MRFYGVTQNMYLIELCMCSTIAVLLLEYSRHLTPVSHFMGTNECTYSIYHVLCVQCILYVLYVCTVSVYVVTQVIPTCRSFIMSRMLKGSDHLREQLSEWAYVHKCIQSSQGPVYMQCGVLLDQASIVC